MVDRRPGWQDRAATHNASLPHCPRCLSHDTEWLKSGGLVCNACSGEVKVPEQNHAMWERDLWADSTVYDDYFHPSRRGADRSEGEWQELESTISHLKHVRNARDFKDVLRMVESSIGSTPHAIEIQLVWACSLFLWGLSSDEVELSMKHKAWYRRNPRRSRFGRVGAALNFTASPIGFGGANLEIAESKTPKRQGGGFRSGVVHAKASSRNGSLGGVKGLAAVDTTIDVANAVRRSGVCVEDAALVAALYSDDDAKPNRTAVTELLLVKEGKLAPPPATATAEEREKYEARRQRLVEDAEPVVTNRIAMAQRQIERAMRLPAVEAIDEDEAALLKPGRDDEGKAKVPRAKAARPTAIEPTTGELES